MTTDAARSLRLPDVARKLVGSERPCAPPTMFSRSLQRLSVTVFSALRHGLRRSRAWLLARPRLAAWVFGAPTHSSSEEDYTAFNRWYFSQFGEQEKMLADRPRMAFYHAAIQQTIRPGTRVIDLGTGTGILAALAARQGAAVVYAIDHSEILDQARLLALHNRVERIEFISANSRQFQLPEKVDVILHEQMGDYLFDEGMVANILDLRDRLLKPGGLIVPAAFEFFCEPLTIRDDRRIPFIWELTVCGYDYGCLEGDRPEDPQYYRHISTDLQVVERFIGQPEPALAFDLHTLQAADLPKQLVIRRTALNDGRFDGAAIFFRARAGESLSLSSSPLDPGRAPHWGFRILRCEAQSVQAGDVIEFVLTVPDWSEPDGWRWTHQKNAPPEIRS